MTTKGAFGYIIGKKKRLMKVQKNADLLWQILVREIFVLMKHFKTTEEMLKAFENIKTIKGSPKIKDIEKFRIFTDLENENHNQTRDTWSHILHFCQSSFINILEAGYILNQLEENGFIFIIDFNKGAVQYYRKELDGKKMPIQSASLEEIMHFEDMPSKSYDEIVSEMKTSFDDFYEKYSKIEKELKKLQNLKVISKNQNAGNIEDKVDKLIDDMKWEKKKLNSTRKVFLDRLQALNLIED
jgi:hypothetical protein